MSDEENKPLTLWEMLQSVLAAAIGVQSGKKRSRDFSRGKPSHFIKHCPFFTWGQHAIIHATMSDNDDDSGADNENDDESTGEVDICSFLPRKLVQQGTVMSQSYGDNGQILSQNHNTKSAPSCRRIISQNH